MFSLNSKITDKKVSCLAVLTLFVSTASGSNLNIPNTFVANQPAVAAQVNANFNAVKTSVNDNNTRLASLEALVTSMQSTITAQQTTISQLQSDLTAVENNTVLELDGLLQYAFTNGHDTAEFIGVNVQIKNGAHFTNGVNGSGNLIIGYNEAKASAPFFCSDPQYTDSVNCIGNLETWAQNVRTGSHNLVIGESHSYTRYASIVAGERNISNANFSSVLGGLENISARNYSTILGGVDNLASGYASSISGGSQNTASGGRSSVSGGRNNTASADGSSVSGGENNSANGFRTSVSGGENNTASGTSASISGGLNGSATGNYDWVAGSLFEDQ